MITLRLLDDGGIFLRNGGSLGSLHEGSAGAYYSETGDLRVRQTCRKLMLVGRSDNVMRGDTCRYSIYRQCLRVVIACCHWKFCSLQHEINASSLTTIIEYWLGTIIEIRGYYD